MREARSDLPFTVLSYTRHYHIWRRLCPDPNKTCPSDIPSPCPARLHLPLHHLERTLKRINSVLSGPKTVSGGKMVRFQRGPCSCTGRKPTSPFTKTVHSHCAARKSWKGRVSPLKGHRSSGISTADVFTGGAPHSVGHVHATAWGTVGTNSPQ